MSSQFLFAYGTLKSDQPEHKAHCPKALSIAPAKACGQLWRIREGYPILKVHPSLAVADATDDPVADWSAIGANAPSPPSASSPDYVTGELHEYPLDAQALRRMDAWENFQPGHKSVYQRRIIWVLDANGKYRLAWAYVCFEAPPGATALRVSSWNHALGL